MTDWRPLPLRHERLDLSVVNEATGRAVGLFADENGVRRGARCIREAVLTTSPATIPSLNSVLLSETIASPVLTATLTSNLSCGSTAFISATALQTASPVRTARSVAAVRDRSTKYGHHCVSDELLDDPTERLDLGPEPRVIAVENRADVLGIEELGTGGEPGHVGEQDRHDPPLLVCLSWRTQQRGTTAVAKAGSLSILLSAGLAGGHGA